MSTHPNETARRAFSDGASIPALGLGVWQVEDDAAAALIVDAVAVGYRSVDTAAIYGNEAGVGEGIRRAGVPRDQLHITSKLWNSEQGYDATLRAFEASMAKLGLTLLDLYLIHWPCSDKGQFVDTWRAFVRLQAEGRVRSIGVSNFREQDLQAIIDATGVAPVLNQIETHPRFQQRPLRAWMAERGILSESWSPLGQGGLLGDPVLARIAARHGRTPAQVVLRWHLDEGLIVIPKASNRAHLADNLAVGGFTLDDEDRAAIAKLDDPRGRIGPDPAHLN